MLVEMLVEMTAGMMAVRRADKMVGKRAVTMADRTVAKKAGSLVG